MAEAEITVTEEQLERKNAAVMADRLRGILKLSRIQRRARGIRVSREALEGALVRAERVERGELPLPEA